MATPIPSSLPLSASSSPTDVCCTPPPSPCIPSKTDVLIVGAGPTGLALAIDLARRGGIDFAVVDMLPDGLPASESRALAVQPRTLEILSDFGIADKFVSVGKEALGMILRVNGKYVSKLDFKGRTTSPFSRPIIIEQTQTERILVEELERLGHHVIRPVAVWKIDDGWRVPEPVEEDDQVVDNPIPADQQKEETEKRDEEEEEEDAQNNKSNELAGGGGGNDGQREEEQVADPTGSSSESNSSDLSTATANDPPSSSSLDAAAVRHRMTYSVLTEVKELSADGCPLNNKFRTIRSRYVVGCDGAHSLVRKCAGILYEGCTVPRRFVVADVMISWGFEQTEQQDQTAVGPREDGAAQTSCQPHDDQHRMQLCMNEFGLLVCFPLGQEKWRIIGVTDCLGDTTGTSEDARIRLATPDDTEVQYIVNRAVPGSVVHSVVWSSAYSVNCRVASDMKVGRCFIAGDAAHVHPPTYGQGMNTGIQDAYNLGWKLACVLKKQAHPSLLESYNSERKQIAAEIVKLTSTPFFFLNTGKPDAFTRCCLSTLAPLLTKWDAFIENFSKTVSMLEHQYKQSTDFIGNNKLWFGSSQPGQRAPDALVKIVAMPPERSDAPSYIFEHLHGGHHTLLLCLNVLPADAKASGFLGCRCTDEAAVRWNPDAFELLAKCGRVLSECIGSSSAARRKRGFGKPRHSNQSESGGVSEGGSDGGTTDDSRGGAKQKAYFGGLQVVWVICGLTAQSTTSDMPLFQQLPSQLLYQVTHNKIPGPVTIVTDFVGEVTSKYGLSFSDSASGASGCFLLVRPDGHISHTGYANNSVAVASALDYGLRYFTM
eukprot:GHVS01008685.1.p1 GENE.GHVS01008685.1~~GHVS01008685.1.p1  ORF type:complete len:827 (+),score=151.73 GHVS01008685.1:78-2558(+)